MKFNTKVRYGLRVMIDIGLNDTESKGVFQKDIAFRQELSVKYLDSIIASLKTARLIVRRGNRGGYRLARAADQITLRDIEAAFGPGVNIVECINDPACCTRVLECKSRVVWQRLNNHIINFLENITLQDIIVNDPGLKDFPG